jgi:MFS family permease
VAELVVMSMWGYLTPGIQIPNYQAILVLGGTALLSGGATLLAFRARRASPVGPVTSETHSGTDPRHAVLRKAATVIALCVLGAFAIGSTFQAMVQTALSGAAPSNLAFLGASIAGLAAVCLYAVSFVYGTELAQNNVKRRVRFFESRSE